MHNLQRGHILEFKNKVKYVREKLCLSQQDLAKATGISFNTINRWENGLRKPTYVLQRKFNEFSKANNIKFEK